MPGLGFLIIAGLAACAGAIVQGGVGLGIGLVASPVVTLVYPSLMPGAILVVSGLFPLLTLAREARHVDWRGFGWAFGARLASTPLGVWVVAVAPINAIGIGVGVMVLLALGVTVKSAAIPRNPATLITAGLIGGATGTATSISGPPMALLYQREVGPRVRATLGLFFTAGALVSLLTLAAAGQLPERQVTAGLTLAPFVLAGFALSEPLKRFLDRGRTRTGILLVVAASATILIVHSLF